MLLAVDNLHVSYGAIVALHGVSLQIERGEIVTLIGANGAGKTTLLRTISGLIRPTEGTVRWEDGRKLERLRADEIVGVGISHVPEGRQIFANMTVRENLNLGAYQRTDKAGIRGDVERCYSLFPVLAERREQRAGTLSGGEQQMLAIGRAMMARPTLLLLDEPSLGLSPLLVQQIFGIIRRINAEQNVAILLVEQNAHIALQTADFGYVLEVGRIVAADHCRTLMLRDDIKEFYLGQKETGARGTRRWKKKRLWN
jgi:branched-chain amino acid transport system ATP-binding protein